jgi:hypothetical protein
MRVCGGSTDAYTRSHGPLEDVRPIAFLAYEQMFASTKNSALAQRTLGALRLTRSFLLLEDDYDVDWEVDLDEPLTQTNHPHRAWLRGPGSRSRRLAKRRAGQIEPARHDCLSPVGKPANDQLEVSDAAKTQRHHARNKRSEARTGLL